ncbi:MAG: ribbon-helix-helix protein, CopG family [Betaproteobacteria bacterium]|nr:ribbon-helix-helix protein, CopG family [Betaproteobacteria bacterium]
MKSISLKLPEQLDARLAAIARRRGGTGRSALIREALERFVEAEAAVRAGSLLESLADLAGTVRGPADLAINPKHLGGFGRERLGHRRGRPAGRRSCKA